MIAANSADFVLNGLGALDLAVPAAVIPSSMIGVRLVVQLETVDEGLLGDGISNALSIMIQ